MHSERPPRLRVAAIKPDNFGKAGLGCFGAFILLFAIVYCIPVTKHPYNSPGEADAFRPRFMLVDRTNMDAPGTPRVKVKIIVTDGLNRSDLEKIFTSLATEEFMRSRAKAVLVLAYREGTNVRGPFTAGRCEYAPYGDWRRASEEVPDTKYKSTIKIAPEYRFSR